jgi:chromate transporter
VVGVIANLAVVFALATLFGDVEVVVWGPVHLPVPQLGTFKPLSLVVALVAAVLLFRLRWTVLRTLGVCALLGLAAWLLGVATS